MRLKLATYIRLWLLGLVALWALCTLATASTDPAAPLGALLVVLGGALLLLGSAPPEDGGRLSRWPLPDHGSTDEAWQALAIGMLAFAGVVILAAAAWWLLWWLSGAPAVLALRVLSALVVVMTAAYLAGVVARAAWLSRKRKRPRPRIRTRFSTEHLECGGMGRHRIGVRQ
jgi:hypothetical protein